MSINPNAILNAPPLVVGSLVALWVLSLLISRGHRLEVTAALVLITFPIYIAVFFAKQTAAVISGLLVSLAVAIGPSGSD